RAEKKLRSLSQIGVQVLVSVREQLDKVADTAGRQLIALVDGSYTNKTVLSQLPQRTTLIGRIRKDSKLKLPLLPSDFKAKGRRRLYGQPAPTPQEVLKDETIPFIKVEAFAAGQLRSMDVKSLGPLFWSR